jgi:hypothetical protein
MPIKSTATRETKKYFAKVVTEGLCRGVHIEGSMEDADENLTIKDIAKLLRCSKTHVQRALRGKVPGMPALTTCRWVVAK